MGAPKGKDELSKLFSDIIIDISEKGMSAISALKGRMSTQTFYSLLEEDEVKSKRYARATEMRAELMANELLEIADKKSKSKDDNIKVQRDRLRVDSRKWLLAKLHPKKYGDKIDIGVDQKQTIEYVNVSKQFPDKK
ncbi:MAG: hypothetical protein WC886_07900 [Saccharofermentanaceae bacterium]|jgi:hypothetical protein